VVFFAGLLPLAGATISGSLFAAIASIVLMMIGMALVAMMISALVPTRSTAMQFVFIASSPAFILSGYTFPLLSMTWPVQVLANLIPLTPFLVAWRRIVLYGAGLADVWSQVLQMVVLVLVFGTIMTIAMRKRRCQSVCRGPQ
jgi:ABC-2 type transport system permease protein